MRLSSFTINASGGVSFGILRYDGGIRSSAWDSDIGRNVQTLTPAGAEFGATSYRIAPRSSAVVDVSETGAEIRVGSVRIHPNVGDPAPIASTVFSFVNGGVTVTENGVAETESGHAFRLFVE